MSDLRRLAQRLVHELGEATRVAGELRTLARKVDGLAARTRQQAARRPGLANVARTLGAAANDCRRAAQQLDDAQRRGTAWARQLAAGAGGGSGSGGGASTAVYRVEGPGNQRLDIDEAGDVSIQGDRMLFLNFGDEGRAQSFQARRIEQGYDGTVVKTFDVASSYVDDLREVAVPESMAGQFPDRPLVVDQTKATDQFGLRPSQFDDLLGNVVPGSGRIHP
jgi:hypothetical protein